MAKIQIINGPNLNLLGTRDPETYGSVTLEEVEMGLRVDFPSVSLTFFQTNIEGEIVDVLQKTAADAVILNAGGYSHSSVSIRDAIDAIKIPVVEVHISNISAREKFRHTSIISPVCAGVIFGFGTDGYHLAVTACQRMLTRYDI
ncbi:MAG: type II 3-dehydroquinate dehydratase [Cryomorphaceae bacterium]|nr:type II 3-dehydroquinate dehydratase [Cryomorphaceae bacterium]